MAPVNLTLSAKAPGLTVILHAAQARITGNHFPELDGHNYREPPPAAPDRPMGRCNRPEWRVDWAITIPCLISHGGGRAVRTRRQPSVNAKYCLPLRQGRIESCGGLLRPHDEVAAFSVWTGI